MSVPDDPFADGQRHRRRSPSPSPSASPSRPAPAYSPTAALAPPSSSTSPKVNPAFDVVSRRRAQQQHPVDSTTSSLPTPSSPSGRISTNATGTGTAPTPPPQILLDPASAAVTGSVGKAAGRRVQWGETNHVAISVDPPQPEGPSSPQTLGDQGASEALRRALEAHSSRAMTDEPASYASYAGGPLGSSGPGTPDLESGPPSEGTNTPARTGSVASDGESGQWEQLLNQMDVYVDPDERDGMPSIHPEREQADHQRAAADLVRAHTSGRFGFLRHRKAGGASKKSSKELRKEEALDEKAYETEEKKRRRRKAAGKPATNGDDDDNDGTGAFGRRITRELDRDRDRYGGPNAPRRPGADDGANIDDALIPPSAKTRRNLAHSGGVLSSLLALQGGGGSSSRASATPSVASTPASSRRGSINVETDSEEDEEERMKFIREQRLKRAMMKGNLDVATTPLGVRSHHKRDSSATTLDPRDDPRRRSGELGNLWSNRSQSSLSHFVRDRSGNTKSPTASIYGGLTGNKRGPETTASSEQPTPPLSAGSHSHSHSHSATKAVANGIKKIGDRLGLEVDRPPSSRSSAGVFGGLIASTGNLAGVAAPSASNIAPDPSRPGFTLARYTTERAVEAVNNDATDKLTPPAGRPHSISLTSPTSPVSSPGDSAGRPRSLMSYPTASGASRPLSSSPTPMHDGERRSAPTTPSGGVARLAVSPGGTRTTSPLGSPPITMTNTEGEGVFFPTTTNGSQLAPPSPSASGMPVSSSFSANAKKRRGPGGIKGIEMLALDMVKAPYKMVDKMVTDPIKQSIGKHTAGRTPEGGKNADDYFGLAELGKKETQEERERREWEKEKRRRRKIKEKKRQEQIFITMHVAAILSRQDFILKLARAFMMFGAPSHRLEAQMQATARVLEVNCQMVYIPGVMLVSFGDPTTHTSETKFLKQANGLDLGKLLSAHMIFWNVVHDKMAVTEASPALDALMTSKATYSMWQNLIIGGLCSAFIQPSAFYGSFIDCLISIPLGALLVLVQIAVSRNDLYSSLFEIVIATINSFLAAAIASSGQFCFAAVASGSVVLILPGYIVLCGSLELGNRSIISGSVRLVYSVLYSLFLGFGLAMGSEVYIRITGRAVRGSTDYTCSSLRLNAPWYRATINPWFYFLTAPCYLILLGMRNGQPLVRKESIVMVIIGCSGFASNYFGGKAFPGRSDITSTIGSFVVGMLGGVYAKFTRGSAFVVMVVGILFQLPSGLANGGLLQFASESSSGNTNAYASGFNVAIQLVQVAIGLTVGLFVSAAIVNLWGGGRRRGANLSSF